LVSKNPAWLFSDGLFHNGMLARSEAAKLFAITFLKPSSFYTGNQVVFKDVPPVAWFYFYLMRLAQNKILDVARTQSGLRQTGGKGALFSPYTFMSEKAAMIWVQNIKTNMKL